MDVQINELKLSLTTVKLTKALFKQMPILGYDTVRLLLRTDTQEEKFKDDKAVVGWVHGSVTGDEYKRWLILKTGEGSYGRYDVMETTIQKHNAKQIYLA